jgi:hypothetical protein
MSAPLHGIASIFCRDFQRAIIPHDVTASVGGNQVGAIRTGTVMLQNDLANAAP